MHSRRGAPGSLLLGLDGLGREATETTLAALPILYPGAVTRHGCRVAGGDADAQWAAYRAMYCVTKIVEPRRLYAWPADWGDSETLSPQIARARVLSVTSETWVSFCSAMDRDGPVMLRVGDRVRLNASVPMRGTGLVVDLDPARADGAWYSVFWEGATKTWVRSQDVRRV